MALPLLKSVEDCSDYVKTVEPFLPQLYDFPGKVLENIASPSGLQRVYLETNPLISAFAVSVFLSVIFLVVSEINRNFSQVDRMWSILPNLYVIHLAVWARLAGLPHSRVDLVAVATTLWSVSEAVCDTCYTIRSDLTIPAGSLDLQLLAQGRLQCWLRRL